MPTTYAIPNGRTVFVPTLYTGNGSTQTIVNGGGNPSNFSFQPDFVWIKQRTSAVSTSNILMDVLRGANTVLVSNGTAGDQNLPSYLTSFNSNGFSIGSGSGADPNDINTNGYTYVGWNWKAGGSGVSNTSGSITSTVSANTSAGFSIVTYTSTTGTVGHGLGVAPSLIIMKGRNVNDQWTLGCSSLNQGSSPWNYGLPLNSTAGLQTNSGFWNNTAPTSSVFSQGSWDSGYTKVAYCFAQVPGFSQFGYYIGNGTQGAGPFIYTGFRPAYVLIRNQANYDWHCYDTSRTPYNYSGSNILKPDTSDAELTGRNDVQIDFLSNGFRLIGNDVAINQSGGTELYFAFAENPFKYANAR